jgi:hypothetical protein
MDEFVKALRHFIFRDAVYIVGGSGVIASRLYRFHRLPTAELPVAVYALLAGMAYFVGWAVQDVASIVRVVSTAPLTPGRVTNRLYFLFTRQKWPKLVPQSGDENINARLERHMTQMIAGATLGPCCLIAFGFVAWKCRVESGTFDFRTWANSDSGLADLTLAIGLLVFSVAFFALSRIKNAQVRAALLPEEEGFGEMPESVQTEAGLEPSGTPLPPSKQKKHRR